MFSSISKRRGKGIGFLALMEFIQSNPDNPNAVAMYRRFTKAFKGKLFSFVGTGFILKLVEEYDLENEGEDKMDNENEEEEVLVCFDKDSWAVLFALGRFTDAYDVITNHKQYPNRFDAIQKASEWFNLNSGMLTEDQIKQRWRDCLSVHG